MNAYPLAWPTTQARTPPPRDGTASPSPVSVREALIARRAAHRSWRALAAEIGMPASGALLARVVAGKQKAPASIYVALGLTPPVRVLEVPAGYGVGRACATCGQVHTTATCPTKRKPRRRYVGLITKVTSWVHCGNCGRSKHCPGRRGMAAANWFASKGWVFSDIGPVCPDCMIEQALRALLDRLTARHVELVEEQRIQYWNFTRQARGKPVDPAVTTEIVWYEEQIAALKAWFVKKGDA
jgi:hypothetical protein